LEEKIQSKGKINFSSDTLPEFPIKTGNEHHRTVANSRDFKNLKDLAKNGPQRRDSQIFLSKLLKMSSFLGF
jgi:hypothetical protein